MSTPPETRPELPGFEKEQTENVTEYLIFSLDPTSDPRKTLSHLETVRKTALQLCRDQTRDYIWQRDEFDLEIKNEQDLIYLHGATDYGDAVEDEWLIVYLLRELTRSDPTLWIRIFDSDGEFLLIEAAKILPKWLSPEIDHNRVWIHDGKLFVVPYKDDLSTVAPRNISLSQSLSFLREHTSELVHSDLIESEAFYRLEKYPAQITSSTHHSLVTIPRKLAYIIHALPKSVAPAIEAFYLRDALALKPLLSSSHPLVFAPQDFVTVSIRFSKVLFAQLRSQRFEAPPRWQEAMKKQESGSEGAVYWIDNGMKLTCGYEILAPRAAKHASRVVRELALELEDLEEDGDAALPSDQIIKSWPDVERNDSEAWLDINYEDFENELGGKRTGPAKGSSEGFGDADAQANLRKIVSRFEAFLNDDQAGLDGAELDEMDEDDDDEEEEFDSEEDSGAEDKAVSFDEEEFTRMMHEMMGLPPSKSTLGNVENKQGASARTKADAQNAVEDEDEEINRLASQMKAELDGHGALQLDPPKEKQAKLKEKAVQSDGKNPSTADNEEDSDEGVQIDYNLAKNILESFKSQGGMSGPTGNLLGMMGVQLPRDEDEDEDEDDEQNVAGPSRDRK